MSVIQAFTTYFEAFEATYIDDDWGRLEPLFDAEAVYEVRGGGDFDCLLSGRGAVLTGLRRCLDGFDRHCQRRIESIEAPEFAEDHVVIHGIAGYRRGDSPELVLRLDERIDFRNGLIVRITDDYPEGLPAQADAWLARWGEGMSVGYV
jgi:hypothetical protein